MLGSFMMLLVSERYLVRCGGCNGEREEGSKEVSTVSVSNPQTLSLTILLQEHKLGMGLETAAVAQKR